MLSNKDIIDIIKVLEKDIQENYPEFVDYFPVLRIFLIYSFRPKNKNKPRHFFGTLFVFLSVIVSIFCLVLFKFKAVKSGVFLCAPAHHRNVKRHDGYCSKHLDSLRQLPNLDKTFVLEFGSYKSYSSVFSFYNISFAMRIFSKFSWKKKESEKLFSNVSDYISCRLLELSDSEFQQVIDLKSWLYRYESNRFLMSWLFKNKQIEKAVFVAYYDLEMMGAISFLKSRNIPIVDYQHGIQNSFHPMYTNWNQTESLPSAVPNEFWVWDGVAKSRVNEWGKKLNVSVKVVGNLWLNLNADDEVSGDGNKVLIALQIWPIYFNDSILKLIDKFQCLQFVIREHPFHPLPNEIKEGWLRQFENLSFDPLNDREVNELFNECAVCITGFSTVGLEAAEAGLKVIFTHPNAKDGLSEYIDSQRIYYAYSESELIEVFAELVF